MTLAEIWNKHYIKKKYIFYIHYKQNQRTTYLHSDLGNKILQNFKPFKNILDFALVPTKINIYWKEIC